MAFTPCTKSVTTNIVPDCANPRVKGWERTGVGLKRSDIFWSEVFSTAKGVNFFVASGKKTFTIYNKKSNPLPFNGTQVSANNDAEGFDKKIQFYYEGVGADASAVIKAFQEEEYVIILERKHKHSGGSYVVFGYEVGLTLESAEYSEETGYWLITMKTTEPTPELNFGDTGNIEVDVLAFNALLAASV